MAIGPIGRNVEAAGVAAFKHVAAVYSYSKTRGFFAGETYFFCNRNSGALVRYLTHFFLVSLHILNLLDSIRR